MITIEITVVKTIEKIMDEQLSDYSPEDKIMEELYEKAYKQHGENIVEGWAKRGVVAEGWEIANESDGISIRAYMRARVP